MITFEIYGVGFELSIGEIDKSKFEYWKDKEILEEEASKKMTNSVFLEIIGLILMIYFMIMVQQC